MPVKTGKHFSNKHSKNYDNYNWTSPNKRRYFGLIDDWLNVIVLSSLDYFYYLCAYLALGGFLTGITFLHLGTLTV
jgi:hypothetical protein